MRFSAAIQPLQPLRAGAAAVGRTPAAADLIRRIVTGEPQVRLQPAPIRVDDLPADLDQRVRLVGEW